MKQIFQTLFSKPDQNRNRAALAALRNLGFPMPVIRRALLNLNGLKVKGLADGKVSPATLSNTLKAVRANKTAQAIVAEALDLKVTEIFPDA